MRFQRTISILIAITFSLSLTIPSMAYANSDIVAANVFGVVELDRGSKTKRVETGTKLKVDDHVKTLGKSTVDFVWNQKVGYRMLGDSECIIRELADGSLHVEMVNGGSIFNMNKLGAPADLKVTTPTAVAAVRGTIFLINISPTITTIVVSTGLLDIILPSSPNDSFKLGAGQAIDAGDNTKSIDVRDATQSELQAASLGRTIPTQVDGDIDFAENDQLEKGDAPGADKAGKEVNSRATTLENVGQEGDKEDSGSSYP